MGFINHVDCGQPSDRTRDVSRIDTIVIHRIDVGATAEAVAAWFKAEGPRVLGTPMMPYHFIIRRNGLVEQALPLSAKAPHAGRWNSRSIGVGCVGDFRWKAPGSKLMPALERLCLFLQVAAGDELDVMRHDVLRGGSKSSAKVCPGAKLDVEHLADFLSEEEPIR